MTDNAVKKKEKRKGNYVRKWNNEKVMDYIIENGYDIIPLSEYTCVSDKMTFRCGCGETYQASWHEVLDKRFPKVQCNKCGRKKAVRNKITTVDEINDYLKKNDYTCKLISDKYKGWDVPLLFKCECGNYFMSAYVNLKATKGRCRECFRDGVSASHEEFIKQFEPFLEGYEVIGKYKSRNKNIQLKCKACGSDIFQTPAHILERGIYCPFCNGTTGEQTISRFLKKHNIEYEREKTFDGCVYQRPLRFDFFIPSFNCCIEYQGKQHYKPIDYFGGDEVYEESQIRDEIKREYCRNNNISLIEIPYWDYKNIEDILSSSFMMDKEEGVG